MRNASAGSKENQVPFFQILFWNLFAIIGLLPRCSGDGYSKCLVGEPLDEGRAVNPLF